MLTALPVVFSAAEATVADVEVAGVNEKPDEEKICPLNGDETAAVLALEPNNGAENRDEVVEGAVDFIVEPKPANGVAAEVVVETVLETSSVCLLFSFFS